MFWFRIFDIILRELHIVHYALLGQLSLTSGLIIRPPELRKKVGGTLRLMAINRWKGIKDAPFLGSGQKYPK